jgi:hypothetical protein
MRFARCSPPPSFALARSTSRQRSWHALIGKANRARNKAGLDRQRDTGERMDALLRGADWAQTGTNGTNGNGAVPSMATERAL